MHLNRFSTDVRPLDMTSTDEFQSLIASARDLEVPHDPGIRYVARNVVARHLRFNVLEWGPEDAPTVVCLHGGHQSAHSWDLVSLSLARRFRVIAPDQRGHGDSEWVRSAHYGNEDMAADLAALIDVLELDRPLVMGHSMGGRNTLLAAQAHPNLARALAVVDIGPEVSERGGRAIASFVAQNEEFEDLDAFVENVRRYDPYRSREHIERTVRYNLFQRADGKYISKCDRLPRKLGLTKMMRSDALTLTSVGELSMPVLVVRGENSNVLEPDAAARFVAALPAGELVTVPDCGHNVHSQNTTGFLAAIEPFLRAHGG
ncbi:MAG: alpha/beta hydrolase [Pseudomonadota bacterium]